MEWLVWALFSVIFASAREILQKRALQAEHTLEFLTVKGFFMIAMSLLFIPFIDFDIPWQGYALCFLVAIVATTGILYRNKALKHKDISIVQPLMNLQPIFVSLIALVFLGEVLSLPQLLGVLFIVLGTYVLEVDKKHHGILGPIKKIGESRYSLMVIFAILLFSVSTVLDRFILTNYATPWQYFVIVWIMISTMMMAWHFLKYRFRNIGTVFREQGTRIFWPSLFSVLMIVSLYNAMSLAYAGLVIAVYRLQSLITTIEGGMLFHEDHLLQKTVACAIMTTGAIMVIGA